MNKYITRLSEEWKLHGKIIVAVDFDDTISPWKTNNQQDCDRIIEVLKEVKLTGAYITIFTACDKDRFEDIKHYCENKNLQIDSINQNPITLPYGNNNKVYANIFIDDRAGLDEALNILQESMYIMRSYNTSKKLDNPGSTEF